MLAHLDKVPLTLQPATSLDAGTIVRLQAASDPLLQVDYASLSLSLSLSLSPSLSDLQAILGLA